MEALEISPGKRETGLSVKVFGGAVDESKRGANANYRTLREDFSKARSYGHGGVMKRRYAL